MSSDSIKSKIAALKGHVTRSKTLANNSLTNHVALRTYISVIESKLIKIDSFHVDCVVAMEEEGKFDTDTDGSIRANLLDSQTDYSLENEIYLTSLRGALPNVNIESRSNNTHGGYASNSTLLPKIKLPRFDGKILEFETFWQQFEAAVHNDRNLSAIQKLTFLRSCLSGDALKQIEFAPNINTSYETVVVALKDKYDDKELLVLSYVESLMHLKVESLKSCDLYKFHSSYRSLYGRLSSIDKDALFVALIMNKLPKQFKIPIQRALKKDLFKIDKFEEIMQQEMKLLPDIARNESGYSFEQSNAMYEPVDAVKPLCYHKTQAVQFNINANNKDKSGGRKPCRFCHSIDHTSRNCVKYPEINARQQRLKELGNVCFKCWLKRHTGKCISFQCQRCNGNHWVAMCNSKNDSNHSAPQKGNVSQSTVAATLHQTKTKIVALPTLDLKVQTHNKVRKPLKVRALLDQGAQRSLVTKSAVRRLKLKKVYSEEMEISGYCSKTRKLYDVVEFSVKLKEYPIKFRAVVIDTLTDIIIPGLEIVTESITAEVSLAENTITSPVELIVGGDHLYDIMLPNIPYRQVNGVWLMPTKLGYVITGKIASSNQQAISTYSVLKMSLNEVDESVGGLQLNKSEPSINHLWDMDIIGISSEVYDNDHDIVLSKFNQGILKIEDRYQVHLPWKENPDKLPNNLGLSMGRLNSLSRRLRVGNLELYDMYNNVFKEQLLKNFIEYVPVNDVYRVEGVHYIPHHPVMRDNPTTPIRVVFDCSSKSSKNEFSMNDLLYSGPSLVPELTKVLLRFRASPYICLSDISKAFLQVSLHPEDRDYTRFLWVKDPHKSAFDYSNLEYFRFKTVLFGATSSPFLLQATIRFHMTEYSKANNINVEHLYKNLYVDNLMGVAYNESNLINFYHESLKCYGEAGLPLREWVSNSASLNKLVHQDNMGPKNESPTVKFLGLLWNKDTDYIEPQIVHYHEPKSKTELSKRIIVSDSSKLFDPLGIYSPITIQSRLIIQDLWKLHKDWDETVPEHIAVLWDIYLQLIGNIQSVSVPRYVFGPGEVSLHIFSDASGAAYGCCAYVIVDKVSHLLFSKMRVAPLKEITIPKLELTAALLSVRMARYLCLTYKGELTISNVTFRIDSTCALAWIDSKKEHKSIYVRNRVLEINTILKQLPTSEFRHIRGNENPADLVTRNLMKSLDQFKNNDLWWYGPPWLVDVKYWPIKLDHTEHTVSVCTNQILDHVKPAEDTKTIKYGSFLPDIHRFSSYMKLLRTTAYLIKFCCKLQGDLNFKTVVSAEEINQAETSWIKHVQQIHYPNEYNYIKDCKISKKVPQMVKQLNLKMLKGLLTIHSRLDKSLLCEDTVFPILLPSKSPFTHLLIMHMHVTLGHLPVTNVMISLRERFWIVRSRQTVRKVLNSCYYCRKYTVKRYEIPASPRLPSQRVIPTSAFNQCGVDYTGALYVKEGDEVRKVYLVLFTCPVTRAVHLELANNMTANEFAFVFRRFISRRGIPRILYSDNGTNFRGHEPILDYLYRNSAVQELLQTKRIEWKFIPARAPWFGAIWERLIGITKSFLRKRLGNTSLNYHELNTIVTEIEARLNDRPLTYLAEDQLAYISPSQLMLGRRLDSLPILPSDHDYEESNHLVINKGLRKIIYIIDQCWSAWKSTYLAFLREQEKLIYPGRSGNIVPKVGDVVLIADEKPSNTWNLGIIIKLVEGSDSNARVVKLKTKHGIIFRPLFRVHPLEISLNEPVIPVDLDVSVDNDPSFNVDGPDIQFSVRPKRQAAKDMLNKLSDWSKGGLI